MSELLALCSELPSGVVPEWVQLIPAGPVFQGRDGRTFELQDPQTVLNAFKGPIPFDCDHATHLGMHAPAAGWIESLEARDTGIWGRVEWNRRGKEYLTDRAYRFVSPVLTCSRYFSDNPDEPMRFVIKALESAGLVNSPNLDLVALNSKQPAQPAAETKPTTRESNSDTASASAAPAELEVIRMKELLKRLGLPDTATEAEALAAVEALEAGKVQAETAAGELNSKHALLLQTHVPRSEFERVSSELNSRLAAEQKREAEAFELELNSILDGACKALKMSPASRPAYEEMIRATCKANGNTAGIVSARKLFDASPVVVSQQSTAPQLNSAEPLTDEEKQHCKRIGISEASFIAAKGR